MNDLNNNRKASFACDFNNEINAFSLNSVLQTKENQKDVRISKAPFHFEDLLNYKVEYLPINNQVIENNLSKKDNDTKSKKNSMNSNNSDFKEKYY